MLAGPSACAWTRDIQPELELMAFKMSMCYGNFKEMLKVVFLDFGVIAGAMKHTLFPYI